MRVVEGWLGGVDGGWIKVSNPKVGFVRCVDVYVVVDPGWFSRWRDGYGMESRMETISKDGQPIKGVVAEWSNAQD